MIWDDQMSHFFVASRDITQMFYSVLINLTWIMVHLKAQSFVAFKVFQAVNCLAAILTSSGLHYTEISELFSYIRKVKRI